jgi:ribonucleoside-diphosphate reductase alpha chain
VEKTQDLAKKIGQARALEKKLTSPKPDTASPQASAAPVRPERPLPERFDKAADRAVELVGSAIQNPDSVQPEAVLIQQYNSQFEHFQDDAPACDVCGSICVRNGACYRCYNCGNSMGCS